MLSVEAIDLYYGASHALRRVSLTAKKGEVTCILGRNGVGKTSLLRAIVGLQPIRAGRIAWEGQVLNDAPPHQRARAGLALTPAANHAHVQISLKTLSERRVRVDVHRLSQVFHNIILNAIHGKPLPVYGRGENVRDWLFVEDHADALLTVAMNGEPEVTTGEFVSLRAMELIQPAIKALRLRTWRRAHVLIAPDILRFRAGFSSYAALFEVPFQLFRHLLVFHRN